MNSKKARKGDKEQRNRTGRGRYWVNPQGVELSHVIVPVPNSIDALPNPLWLRRKDLAEVRSFERSILRNNKVKPGIYNNWTEVKEILFPVHDRLLEETDKRVNELDGSAVVIQLYDQLEVMYGTLEKHRLDSMAMASLLTNNQIPIGFAREWMERSPQLLGTRFLIEVAIKNCSKARKPITNQCLLKLMAFGTRIAQMDAFLETMCCKVIPNELVITGDVTAEFRSSKLGTRSMKLWEDARKESLFNQNLDYLKGLQGTISEPVKENQLTENRVWKMLDSPMKSELGYSLTDWLHLNKALIEYFDDYERLKVVPKDEFIKYLQTVTRLESSIISLLLEDRILSRHHMAESSLIDMLPAENFWRDLRLTNRPIVEIEDNTIPIVVLGVETVQHGFEVYFRRLIDGRARLPRTQPNGPLTRAFGAIYEKSGDVFRDEIISRCKKMGLQAVPEKASVRGAKIPQGIGPVDAFIFDKPHGRFILVEAKDVSARITPRELKEQRDDFVGSKKNDPKCFLSKLHRQEHWFRSHLSGLKEEYSIMPDQEVGIEGVVVVSHPMLWVFSQPDAIPVLDDYEFFRRLKSGKTFIYEPTQ